jgi:hypothetical protein
VRGQLATSAVAEHRPHTDPSELSHSLPSATSVERKAAWKSTLAAHQRLCADDSQRAREVERVTVYNRRTGGGNALRRQKYDVERGPTIEKRLPRERRGYAKDGEYHYYTPHGQHKGLGGKIEPWNKGMKTVKLRRMRPGADGRRVLRVHD